MVDERKVRILDVLSFGTMQYIIDLVERKANECSAQMHRAIEDGRPDGEVLCAMEKYRQAHKARAEIEAYFNSCDRVEG